MGASMLTDDDQFANFLAMNGLLAPDAVARLRIAAELEEKPLYVTVIEKGAVPETTLVQMMASLLGVASVSLAEFEGDPAVLARVPRDQIRSLGVLPVGIDDSSGTALLYVAMANPLDSEAVQSVQQLAQMPVVPLLAGPVDLLQAIERAVGMLSGVPQTHGFSRATKDSFPAGVPNSDDAVDLVEEFAGVGSARSALGLLDDIPRNRHEQPTSPSGVISLADYAMESSLGEAADPAASALRMMNEPEGTLASLATAETAYFDAGSLVPDPGAESGFVRFGSQKPGAPGPISAPIALAQGGGPFARAGTSSPSAPNFPFTSEPSGERTGMGFPSGAPSGPFRRVGGTPLTGVAPVNAPLSQGPFGAPGAASTATGAFPSAAHAALASGHLSGAFVATPSAHEGDVVMSERADDLARAAIAILLRRGLITERELRDELVKIRAAGGR